MRRAFLWMFLPLTFCAITFTSRWNPGGPFISISGNIVLPLYLIALTVVTLRATDMSGRQRSGMWLMVVVSLLATFLAAWAAIAFWYHPTARGATFGW